MSKILNSTIGIAGCGTMGLPMLEVLLKNNINAFGYDILSKENFSSLENNFISSKKDFFQKVDVIFSVVRDINQTKELCEGKNGLFQLNSPKTLIISSTLSPAFLNDFFQNAPENITMIEAPMSGAPMKAKDATLTFMVGAEKNQYENIFFPNPSTDVIIFSERFKLVEIYNSIGQQIKVEKNGFKIDVSELKPGNYIVVIDREAPLNVLIK
mgnify:CR=1 FL=1